MKKLLFSSLALLGIIGVAGIAQASLYNYFGGHLPSITARQPLALKCGLRPYSGTFKENVRFEACLRSNGLVATNNRLGGSISLRPTEFKTSLAEQKTQGHTDTTLKVTSVLTKDGNSLASSTLGTTIVLSINPGASNSETVLCTSLNASSTPFPTFTGCTFGYRFDNPTATSSANIKAHSPGEPVIISNTDTYTAQKYVLVDGDTTISANDAISGQWNFSIFIPTTSVANNSNSTTQFATVNYVNNVATSGAANAALTVKGIVQEASAAMLQSSSSTGSTGARTYANGGSFAQTTTANSVPVSDSTGSLTPGWVTTTNTLKNIATSTASASQLVISDASSTVDSWTTAPANFNNTLNTLTTSSFWTYTIPLLSSSTVGNGGLLNFSTTTGNGDAGGQANQQTHTRYGGFMQSGQASAGPGAYATQLMGTTSLAFLNFSDTKQIRIKFRASLSSTAGNASQYSFGLAPSSSTFTTASTSLMASIRFIITANSATTGNVGCAMSDGAVNQNNAFPSFLFNIMNTYEIVVTPGTSVQFWVNGALQKTYTTNIPTSGLELFGFGLDTNGNTGWNLSDIYITQQL